MKDWDWEYIIYSAIINLIAFFIGFLTYLILKS